MRYFLIVSVALHAVAFTMWTASDATRYHSRPGSIAVLITEDAHSRITNNAKQAAKDASTDTRPDQKSFTKTAVVDKYKTTRPTNTSMDLSQSEDPVIITEHYSKEDSHHVTAKVQTSSNPVPGSQIRDDVMRAFIPYFTYPELARKNGWQGTVELEVHIDAIGRLSDIRILHSSGYGLLDHAAITSLAKLSKVPEASRWQEFHGTDITIPVHYRLIDS